MEDFLGYIFADSTGESLFQLIGTMLKHLLLFILSPYLVLRGWLRVRPGSAGVRELYQQGKQAAAHDMQYVLSVVAALPLAALFGVVIWHAGQEVFKLLR